MTNAIKPTKITFKKVESEWFNYHNTLKEVARLREEIMNPFDEFPDQNTGGGSNSVRAISDPTATVATRMITSKQLDYLTEIVEAIERVYNALPDNYKKLVRMRYWSKNNQKTWEGLAIEFGKSERQLRRWRNDVVQATIELLGWR